MLGEVTHGSLPCGPIHSVAASSEWASKNPRERTDKLEVTVLYKLISEVTFHHFCHILLIKSKLLSPAPTEGVEISQGPEQEKEITESYSEAASHSAWNGFVNLEVCPLYL